MIVVARGRSSDVKAEVLVLIKFLSRTLFFLSDRVECVLQKEDTHMWPDFNAD